MTRPKNAGKYFYSMKKDGLWKKNNSAKPLEFTISIPYSFPNIGCKKEHIVWQNVQSGLDPNYSYGEKLSLLCPMLRIKAG